MISRVPLKLFVHLACIVSFQTVSGYTSSPGIEDLYSELGIQVTARTPMKGFADGSMPARFLKIRLRDQAAFGVGRVAQNRESKKLEPGHFSFVDDNFENGFPSRDWQLLTASSGYGWSRYRTESPEGQYDVAAPLAAGSNGTNATSMKAISWLISGPFDLRKSRSAIINFYVMLNTRPGKDLFFCGVSKDGDEFQGLELSGDSHGWQFINLNLADLISDYASSEEGIWLGFLWASTDVSAGPRVQIDNVCLSRDEAWVLERYALMNGEEMPHVFSGGLGLSRPALADIDADGDFDLFVGEYDGHLNFYRNDGNRFSPKWTLVTSEFLRIDVGEDSAPAFYDIDLDGDLDLFIGTSAGVIQYFENVGNPFTAIWQAKGRLRDATGKVLKGGPIATPAFTDVDSDGDYDLFIGNETGVIAFYRNDTRDGDFVFTRIGETYLNIDVGSLSAPAFADINGDGYQDLFCGIREKAILYYQGNREKAVFSLLSKDFIGIEVGETTAPAFADLDGDGDLDVCVGQADGNLVFFRNQGTAKEWVFESFPKPFSLQTLDVGFQTTPVLVDIDGDEDLDLVTGNSEGKLFLYENTGTKKSAVWRDASEQFKNVKSADSSTPAFVDIDGDDDLDLFLGRKLGRLTLYENRGTRYRAQWQLVTTFYDSIQITKGNLIAPAFYDIDADGDQDLFIGSDAQGVDFFRNMGTATEAKWAPVQNNYWNLKRFYRPVPVFADLDDDGDADLMVGTKDGTLVLMENTGTRHRPRFEEITRRYHNIDVRYFSVPALGDIDADGDLDLFVGNNSGGLYFWRNFKNEPSYSDARNVSLSLAAAHVADLYQIPQPFHLGSAIRYRLPKVSDVRITIRELSGKLIDTLVDERQSDGRYAVTWRSRDSQQLDVTSGLYIVSIQIAGKTRLEKILVVR